MSQRVETYVARISQPPSWWPSAPLRVAAQPAAQDPDIAADRNPPARLEVARARATNRATSSTPRRSESVDNKAQVLDDAGRQQVMRLAAEGAGILVSDAEVRAEIQRSRTSRSIALQCGSLYQMLLGSQSPPLTAAIRSPGARQPPVPLVPSRLTQSSFVTGSEARSHRAPAGRERRDVPSSRCRPRRWTRRPGQRGNPGLVPVPYARLPPPRDRAPGYIRLDGATLPPPVVGNRVASSVTTAGRQFSSAERARVARWSNAGGR